MDAKKRIAASGKKRRAGLVAKLLRCVQERLKLGSRSKRIEPWIAQHCRMAKETTMDSAGKHFQRWSYLIQVSELPRQVIHPLRVPERGLHQLFAARQTFLALAFQERAQGRQVQFSKPPRFGEFPLLEQGHSLFNTPEHGQNQARSISVIARGSFQRPLIIA